MDTQLPDIKRAMYACVHCRILKRKCTRELPECSLCVRLHKICDYSATNNNMVQANQYNGQRERNPIGLSTNLLSANLGFFPAQYFLNSNTHQQLSINFISDAPTPPETLALIGSAEEVHIMCDLYFSETQNWLPFLSEMRMAERVRDFGAGCDIRLALLLLSMKLVTSLPSYQQDAVTSLLYQSVRELATKVETACLISLELLQSVVLMSIYEMGHGIYPAGFLSIARAGRLSIVMGLHDRDRAPQLFKEPDTWALCEEERRSWWVVLILDRFVQLGISGVPLATPEPASTELLPCTDAKWDSGQIGVNQPLFQCPITPECRVGTFANECQSAHILGRVLDHRNDTENCTATQIRLAEATHIHQTLVSLTKHLLERFSAENQSTVSGSRLAAMSLCYSARLILYKMYSVDEQSTTETYLPEKGTLREISITGIKEMIQHIYELAQHILRFKNSRTSNFAPLICHTLYLGSSGCAWLVRDHGEHDQLPRFKTMVDSLKILGRRWKVVDEYLKMLKDEGSLTWTL